MVKGVFFAIALFASNVLLGQISQGEMLEKQMWADIKEQNFEAIERHIAEDFQSIRPDGARTRDQELEYMKHLTLGNYTISDMKVTEDDDTLVVTYTIAYQASNGVEALSSKRASGLSLWRNNGEMWHWIAHAELIPISN
jgi:hypothetical protein